MAHTDCAKNPMIPYYMSTDPPTPKSSDISISKRLNKKSSSEEIFNETKSEYETALKNSRYQKAELKFHKEENNTQK